MHVLNRYFELSERNTSVAREVRGGVATFLTMAYILFANAGVLSAAGMPAESVVACTALAAGVCCIAMGLYANLPVALASGMGLNAIVAFQIAPLTGSWQSAMGVVVLDGLAILVLVIAGLREAVMHAIPRELRMAIGAGIGLLVAFIGLVQARLVIPSGVPGAPLTFGSLANSDTVIAAAALLLTALLMAWRVAGAILIGIGGASVAAAAIGLTRLPQTIAPPSFEVAFKADVVGAFRLDYVPMLLALMMVDFFDTLGTATAIGEQAGLRDDRGQIPRLRRLLLIDSLSASVGGLLGASSVTSYVESAAGVAEGARTGLHTVVVGLLFLLAILLAPLANMVPPAATAPALVLVGFLMCSQIAGIRFDRLDTAIPAFIILLMIPLTWSISHGIGYGFLAFVFLKLATLKWREVHPLMYATAAAFLAWFVWAP